MSFTLDPVKAIENGLHSRFDAIAKKHPALAQVPGKVQGSIDKMKPALAKLDQSVLPSFIKLLMPTATEAEVHAFLEGAIELVSLEQRIVVEVAAVTKELGG